MARTLRRGYRSSASISQARPKPYEPQLPAEMWDEIASYCVWDSRRSYWHFGLYPALSRIDHIALRDLATNPKWLDLKTLCQMRLVCRELCRAATLVLQRNRSFLVRPSLDKLDDKLRYVLHATNNGRSYPSIHHSIKGLRLQFESYIFPSATLGGDENDRATVEFRHMLGGLPQLFPVLQNLETFEVKFRHWGRSLLSPRSLQTISNLDSLVNLDEIDRSVSLISKCLQVPFTHLRQLRLELSCTHDFRVLADTIPDDTLRQLRHLHLETTDERSSFVVINPDGNLSPEIYNFAKYPHDDYTPAIFEIVSRCTNLKSLCVRGATALYPNPQDWHPPSSGLEILYLSRVKIGARRLMELLSPRDKRKPLPLQVLVLDMVELTEGRWDKVFDFLTGSAYELSLFYPHEMRYEDSNNPEPEPLKAKSFHVSRYLHSPRKSDVAALKALLRQVHVDARGCEYNRIAAEDLANSARVYEPDTDSVSEDDDEDEDEVDGGE